MKKGKVKSAPAFWDTSAIIPLCCQQPQSAKARQLLRKNPALVAWWGTAVEASSAFNRLLRQGYFTAGNFKQADHALNHLVEHWHEVQPLDEIRSEAKRLLKMYPLRAADALQLAAAMIWCRKHPKQHLFISADVNLLNAVHSEGFSIEDIN